MAMVSVNLRVEGGYKRLISNKQLGRCHQLMSDQGHTYEL